MNTELKSAPQKTMNQPKLYEPLKLRAWWIIILLTLDAGLSLCGLALNFWTSSAMLNATAVADRAEWLKVLNSQVQVISFIHSLLFISTAIVFILWMRRAHRNLTALGAQGLHHRDSEVFWAFLVPVMSTYKPIMIASEIWKASRPKSGTGTQWRKEPVGFLPVFWWACWLITAGSGKEAELFQKRLNQLNLNSVHFTDLVSAIQTFILTSDFYLCMNFLAALLACTVVWKISSNQQRKLGSLPGIFTNISYDVEAQRRGILYDFRVYMGTVLTAVGTQGFWAVGIVGLILCSFILYKAIGNWTFATLFVFPGVWSLVPWYALFFQRNWLPLVLNYGGGILCAVLCMLGSSIKPANTDMEDLLGAYKSTVDDCSHTNESESHVSVICPMVANSSTAETILAPTASSTTPIAWANRKLSERPNDYGHREPDGPHD